MLSWFGTPKRIEEQTFLHLAARLRANDPAVLEWSAFMKKYYPDGDLGDIYNVYGAETARRW